MKSWKEVVSMEIIYWAWLRSNFLPFVVTAICYLYYFLRGRYKKKKADRDNTRGLLCGLFVLMMVMQIITFDHILDIIDANPEQKTGVLTYKESGKSSYRDSDQLLIHEFIIDGEEHCLYVSAYSVDDFDLQVGETYNVTYGIHSEIIIDVEHVEEIESMG